MENNPLIHTNPDLPKPGRPPVQPTLEQRNLVKKLASWGLRQRDIASAVNMDPKTLRKHCPQELKAGLVEAKSNVLHSLFDMATSRRNAAATIFWAKTRAGFAPKRQIPARQNSHSSPSPEPVRRSSLEGLTAHCNDGAPNGDI